MGDLAIFLEEEKKKAENKIRCCENFLNSSEVTSPSLIEGLNELILIGKYSVSIFGFFCFQGCKIFFKTPKMTMEPCFTWKKWFGYVKFCTHFSTYFRVCGIDS